ncbi:hypothetical protein [Streptomyces sp. C1-2]|uniref:hypothetical protein n=1 Tax=Streptomyces sp. C1-2 TaxID=2720022 RepID=UPI0014324FFE|nr:hypothetical protein [Streptomyces sp. C1-2]NJP71780.1 hypothetical protein [Streptomyces sp. C1-2]
MAVKVISGPGERDGLAGPKAQESGALEGLLPGLPWALGRAFGHQVVRAYVHALSKDNRRGRDELVPAPTVIRTLGVNSFMPELTR